jgi:hypothetical protein
MAGRADDAEISSGLEYRQIGITRDSTGLGEWPVMDCPPRQAHQSSLTGSDVIFVTNDVPFCGAAAETTVDTAQP